MATTTAPRREVGRADQLGFDPAGGPWVTLCLIHHTVLNSRTRDLARAARTVDFCDDCRGGPAVWVDCPGVTNDGAYYHSLRDHCYSCAPWWARIPTCPDDGRVLLEDGFCRSCHRTFEVGGQS